MANVPAGIQSVALSAQLAQLRGDSQQALADYQLAFDLGDRRSFSLQQLVSLLYQNNRIAEAQDYLARLTAEQPTNQLFSALAIEQAVQQNRVADAVELAKKDIQRFPNDAVRHVWLANLLMRDHRPQEAVDILRAATVSFPKDGRVWNALFVVLAQNGQNEEARRTLDAMIKGKMLPMESRHYVAAQGFETLGDVAEAKKQYELAIADQPDEIAVRLRYAKFLLANETEAAKTQYEQVLTQDPDNAEARRELANLLAASGRDADWAQRNGCWSGKRMTRRPMPPPMIDCGPCCLPGKAAPVPSESPTAALPRKYCSS